MQRTDEAPLDEVRAFILARRQAVLAVCDAGEPLTAMTAYVAEPGLAGLLIHLSDLSPHKRVLLKHPTCSLLIAESDDGRAEVMSLARVMLQGVAAKIEKASDDYEAAKARFLARLPARANVRPAGLRPLPDHADRRPVHRRVRARLCFHCGTTRPPTTNIVRFT
jgi:nitroimidazol reductase NimA-like FMN-containing flavoprotein (pyridoxamine 5'-phosphate oxidase superfamily)